MTTSRPGKDLVIESVSIDSVIPYWRNPRRISEEAVNAVAESIRRYGYLQPIVVDEQKVIILGHTRYSALRRLGVEKVDIGIAQGLSQERVKQLRILDNRVAEFNFWDFDKLVEELGQLDAELMAGYFPEVLGSFEDDPSSHDYMNDLNDADELEGTQSGAGHEHNEVEFVCPKCFHGWKAEVSLEQVKKGLIKA